ncbi:MAG: hypothetical protein AB7P49_06395 [Bdellovibrionales bacterium]
MWAVVPGLHAQLNSGTNPQSLLVPPARSELNSESLAPVRPWTGEWNFQIGGLSFEEGKDEGAAAFLYFSTRFEYRFSSLLKARVKPQLQMYSSRVQERYDNDFSESRVRMDEAHLAFQPVQQLELRAGAIDQGELSSPLLVANSRAFPGFQEILSQTWGNYRLGVMAQQVVPTSYSLNTEREREEELPTFLTESLHVSAREFDNLDLDLSVGRYHWSDLPDKVAFESARVGNRVAGEVAPGARFLSGFDGLFLSSRACWCGPSWLGLVGEFQRVHNSEAPPSMADAQMWGLGPRLNFGRHELDLRYRSYFVESDATVANYNRAMLGHTNRIGDNIEARLDFKEQKFAIVGEWVNARTLRESSTQKTLTSYYIGVETHYAPF